MLAKQITSRDNPFYKNLRKLMDSARERKKSGKTLLDGDHLISAYLATGGMPETLILGSGASQVPAIARLLASLDSIPLVELPAGLFADISPVKSPTGILALIGIPVQQPAGQDFCVLLEDIQDPGNLGSILRSAAASGVQTAYLSKHCADAWSPKVLRGGMGAHFALSIQENSALTEVAKRLPGMLLAASLDGEMTLYETPMTGAVAFAIGNEGAGLSSGLEQCASQKIKIPMPGQIESLNAAAAAAICFFERVRQIAVKS